MTPTELFGRVLTVVSSRGAARTAEDIREREQSFTYYSDDDLRSAAQDYISGRMTFAVADRRLFWRWFKAFSPSPLDERELAGVALAAAAFRRAPADLRGEHPQLFDSQLAGASFIVMGHHVQMDTGEGKTYALIAAAFAALGRVERVYILTANEMLAERDALRTKQFWDWLGISVGLCTSGYGTAERGDETWGAQVIYTTASALAFKYVGDAIGRSPALHPIIHGTVLLDETDAILFDGRSDIRSVVTSFATDPQSWAEAFDFARTLTADDVDDRFLIRGDVALSPRGWERLTSYRISTAGLGLWRLARMVEAAYVALHWVRLDVDYTTDGPRPMAIDRQSGLATASRPDWLIALSNSPGFETIPSTEELYSASFLTLLRAFDTVGGASGTASSVALDVWLTLGSHGLPASVAARAPRWDFEPEDEVYRTRDAALAAAAQDALQNAQTRPVLVGAQNARDAREFHALVSAQIEQSVEAPDLVLVLEDNWSVRSFDEAGSVGRITITSYFAARGTDIRLDAAARSAGGLHLTLLGRSREGRLDRQFLGRAGRQGEPWTARVFSSLDMDLFQAFAAGMMGRIMEKSLPDGSPIESRMVSNALARAQRTATRLRQSVAAVETMLSETTAAYHATYERVHRAMQRLGAEDSAEADVHRWLAENLMERSNHAGTPGTVAAFLSDALAGATGLGEIVSAVARSSDPVAIAVDQISESIGRAVAARRVDIAEHARYHEALNRFSAALHQARSIDGRHGQRLVRQAVPLEPDELERLAARLETALVERESVPAGGGENSVEAVAADAGHVDACGPALTDEALELAGIEWTMTGPCLRSRGCPRLTRTDREALFWEAHRIWQAINRERDAAFLEIRIADASYGAKAQRRAMATELLTEKMERQLASRLVWVLLSLDQWAMMDETFYVRDRQERWPAAPTPRRGDWDRPPTKPNSSGDRLELVIRALVEDADEGESEDIEQVVRAFLRGHPIAGLQSGRKCAEAMTRFEEEDVSRGVAYHQRRRNLVRISTFLAAAQAAQLIPEAPSRWDRVGARAKRATLTVRYARHFDAVVALPALVVLLVASSFISYEIPATAGTDALPLVVVWALFTTAVYVVLMSITADRERQLNTFEGLIPLLAGAALLLGLARALFPDGELSLDLLTSSLVASVIAFYMWRFVTILRTRVGIDVLAAIGATVGFVSVLLGRVDHVGWIVAVLFAGAVEVARTMLDREKIEVVGGAVDSLHTEATRVDTFVTVRLGSALGRYTAAMIAMLLSALWPGRSGIAGATTFQVLALVGGALVLVTVVDVSRRTAPSSVRTVLAQQRVIARGDDADLEQRLLAGRRRVRAREFVAIGLTLGGASVLAAPSAAPATMVAVSMYVGVLIATFTIRFLTSAQSSFAGFASNTVVLEYDPPVSGSPGGSFISRAFGRVRTRRLWAIVVGAYVFTVHVLDFIDVVGALQRVWNALWGMVF